MIWRKKLVAWVTQRKASPQHGEEFTIGFSLTAALFGLLFVKLAWLLCFYSHLTKTGGGAMWGESIAAIIGGVVEGFIEIAHNNDKLRKQARAVRHEDPTMI
jgi:hypothetical protein